MILTLIQHDDCELCDEAWALLSAAGVRDFDSLWIDGDPVLQARYGARVPVLRRYDSGEELDWPFDGEVVRRFISTPLP